MVCWEGGPAEDGMEPGGPAPPPPTDWDDFTIAGSCGNDCAILGPFGGSQTWMSLMSLPRNMMYSNTSSLGGTGRSVGRSSVPNDRTFARATVDSFGSMVYKIPSYRISAFEIRLILLPRYGIPPLIMNS